MKDMQKLEWSPTLCNGERVNFKKAEEAIDALGEGWRLPTRQELESILDLSSYDPAVDQDRFPDTKSTWYWTSTKCAWDSSAVWIVHFYGGYVLDYNRGYDACVRAVRVSQ